MVRSAGFRPARLLDPELPWVVAWKWAGSPRTLAAAEAAVPLLLGGPGRARLRSLCAVLVMPTHRALESADDLTGGVLAQFDREPGDNLPDELPWLPGDRLAARAWDCGVRLLIADQAVTVATAFDDESLARLRERYLATTRDHA